MNKIPSLALSIALAFSVAATGHATMILDGQTLAITGGPLAAPATFGSTVLDTQTITIVGTGRLDIANNSVIVRMDDFAKIYGYVVTGYNGGAWDGPGINSSTAANDPDDCTAVGIINNAEANYPSFMGVVTPAGTETLITYTYYGDANLDRVVDQNDFLLIGTGTGWYHGDFNYNGTIDLGDYALFERGLVCQVPEPGAFTLVAAGAIALFGVRRRSIETRCSRSRFPSRL